MRTNDERPSASKKRRPGSSSKGEARAPGSARKAAPAKVNPFDLRKNKTRFEALGRKNKGSSKNVIKARQEATNKASDTAAKDLHAAAAAAAAEPVCAAVAAA